MNVSRRQFALLGSVACFGAASGMGGAGMWPGFKRAGADMYFDWKPIGDRAWAGLGEGGNTLVVAAKGELLLIDTKFPAFAAALRREALETAKGAAATLKLVINTHHHADHTGGNLAFSKDVPILAQTKARPRIVDQIDRYRQQPKGAVPQLSKSDKPASAAILEEAGKLAEHPETMAAADFEPTRTFETEHEFMLGGAAGEKVVLRHFGAGHTDNDAIVFFPGLNILHAGDLLFNKLHPFMDVGAGSNSAGWMESCRRAAALCNDATVVVPGHGAVSDKAGLLAQIEYFRAVTETVKAAVKAGSTREEVLKLPLEQFKDYDGQQRRGMALGAVYDEIHAAAATTAPSEKQE